MDTHPTLLSILTKKLPKNESRPMEKLLSESPRGGGLKRNKSGKMICIDKQAYDPSSRLPASKSLRLKMLMNKRQQRLEVKESESSLQKTPLFKLFLRKKREHHIEVAKKDPTTPYKPKLDDKLNDIVELAVEDRVRKNKLKQKGAQLVSSIAHAGIFTKIASGKGHLVPFSQSNKPKEPFQNDMDVAMQQQPRPEDSMWGLLDSLGKTNEKIGSIHYEVALPTATDLSFLPSNLKATFFGLAGETLKKFLYPRSLLWLHRREAKKLLEYGRTVCPEITVKLLREQTTFKQWPTNVLESVIQVLELCSYEAGKFIIHEDEASGSGIFFIMCGNVKVVKKINRSKKSIGSDNTKTLVTLSPVVCVGEFLFLTEEPRMASIRAITRVHCLVLRKQDFTRFVKTLPEDTFAQVIEAAFATRNRNMHLANPMTEQHLSKFAIFKPCPPSMLRQFVSNMVPCAMPKDVVVCRKDQPSEKIFFLMNGLCGVFRKFSKRSVSDEVHVITVRANAILCDVAVLYGSYYTDTYRTLKTCDFWVLSRKTFDQTLHMNMSAVQLMMAEARVLRQAQLSLQKNLFKKNINSIPLLKNICSKAVIRPLINKFVARVYKPLSVITSCSQSADRVIILYRGDAQVYLGSNKWAKWHVGDCAGYTCIIPHRWAYKSVALDIVECIELSRSQYEEFLENNNVLMKIKSWVKRLMFPLAFDEESTNYVHSLVDGISTPSLYPISYSENVDFSQEGFLLKHLSYLESHLSTEFVKESDTPLPLSLKRKDWKRSSEYLWLPTSSQKPSSDIERVRSDAIIQNLRNVGKTKRKELPKKSMFHHP